MSSEQLPVSSDQPPSGQQPAAQPGPVPYDRFTEVNNRAKELEKQLAAFQSQAKTAEEKRLQEEAKWQQLAEKREKELQAMQAQLQEASVNQLRLQVAAQHGLPTDLAARLVGSTLEELTADAQKMLAYLKPSTPGIPPLGGNRQPVNGAPTPEQLRDAKWVRENRDKVIASGQK